MSRSDYSRQLDPALQQRLLPVIARVRLRRVWVLLAGTWLAAACVAVVMLIVNLSAESVLDPFVPRAWFWLTSGTCVATGAALVFVHLTSRPVVEVARQIETRFPELDAALMTAIEQRPDARNQLGYLQQDVIRRAVDHSRLQEWKQIIPGWQLVGARIAAVVGLIGVIVGGIRLGLTGRPIPDASVHLFDDVESQQTWDYRLTVKPGNTEVERGTRLLVLAEFSRDVPPNAQLNLSSSDGTETTIPMTKSLDDPVFAGRVSQVEEPLSYRVAYGEETSDLFHVSIFEYPRLERCDADLTFPSYTNLPARTLQDVRRISAVEGTQAKLKAFVNKSMTTATLIPEDSSDPQIALNQDPQDPLMWTTDVILDQSQKYRLRLRDAKGRENKAPPRFAISALANQPPKIQWAEPSRDVQVSPIEEINLRATAWDDLGLQRMGVSYSIGGAAARELVLSESKSAKRKHPIQHLLELESIEVEPDQLIAYHFWAEDFGPDGVSRRAASDMFFAEVRPFEEIYRQAQGGGSASNQNGQAGNQNAQQAMQLAELQKEIINATWCLIRRETAAQTSRDLQKDVAIVLESQQAAFAQADTLIKSLQDELSLSLGDELLACMTEAILSLTEAGSSDSARPLGTAMRHEQAAYQTLLRMRAREFEVQQANAAQSTQSGSQQNRQQRQMQQLDLQQRSDRYQQERLARDEQQQTAEQRENRQILSRLRELARRQHDLNQRVKELQSVLEEATSETEKQQIEKQLKRLQEEQQQIQRDAEELQERMQQPQNQEKMSPQADQLEQARQNAQQSSQALQERQLSRAAAAGTRAERELKDLRDEFQKRSSGQFDQQLRQMRNQAQDLQQQQQDLQDQLREQRHGTDEPTSLSATNGRDEFLKKMEQGQQAIEELREAIRQTVEEADEFEPLLADKLYETYRGTELSRPDRALESARRSFERGFNEDAQAEQQRALEGIDDLKQGLDEAAESVLGDETESLKMARDSLRQLSQQLEQEIKRAQPESSDGDGKRMERARSESRGEDADAETSTAERNSQRPGDRQQTDRESGSRRLADESTDDLPADRGRNRRMGGFTGPQDNRDWAPMTGGDFRAWSDRLRDVEEMLSDPDLRAEAARIRDRAKALRKDQQRHSQKPNWDLVKLKIAEPLVELGDRVSREILRRDQRQSLIPLDREPVPIKYEKAVQKYYEQLGSGK